MGENLFNAFLPALAVGEKEDMLRCAPIVFLFLLLEI
jgi:hypothetical protein|tara:strand:+ start:241 stop:351 length:111 start_codon:yes stop_codon:yes gene_type:complete